MRKIEFDPEELRKLCDQGLTQNQIGEVIGASGGWVGKTIKRLGIKRENLRAMKRPEKEVLKKMIEEGLTQEQIGKKYDCHAGTVCGWIKYYGLRKVKSPGKKKQEPYTLMPIISERRSHDMYMTLTPEQAHDLNMVIMHTWQKKAIESPQEAIKMLLHEKAEQIKKEKQKEVQNTVKKYKHIGNGNWRQV